MGLAEDVVGKEGGLRVSGSLTLCRRSWKVHEQIGKLRH